MSLISINNNYDEPNNNRGNENGFDSAPLPVMLTVNEIAKKFGISKHYARQLALNGKVNATRTGTKILINVQSVADYFNSSKLTDYNESVSHLIKEEEII